jgi:hypothetical protein
VTSNVDLVVCGYSAEAHALRATLESLGVQVRWRPATTYAELEGILAEEHGPEHLLISARGIREGFVVPTQSLMSLPLPRVLGCPELLRAARFDGQLVVSTAATTGSAQWGRAFISAGAHAYVAPVSRPAPASTLPYLSVLYYLLIHAQLPLTEAARRASELDQHTAQFTLHRRLP